MLFRSRNLDSCDAIFCITCNILEADSTYVHRENVCRIEVSEDNIVAIVAKRLDCELLRIVYTSCSLECVFELVTEDLCLNY